MNQCVQDAAMRNEMTPPPKNCECRKTKLTPDCRIHVVSKCVLDAGTPSMYGEERIGHNLKPVH